MLSALGLRPGNPNFNGSAAAPLDRKTLDGLGIDKKFSSRTQKIASISERAIEARIADWRRNAGHRAFQIKAKPPRYWNCPP
jgi:hypothetical protein